MIAKQRPHGVVSDILLVQVPVNEIQANEGDHKHLWASGAKLPARRADLRKSKTCGLGRTQTRVLLHTQVPAFPAPWPHDQ